MDLEPLYDILKEKTTTTVLRAALGLVLLVGFASTFQEYIPFLLKGASQAATTELANSQGVPTYTWSGTGYVNPDPLLANIPAGEFPTYPNCNTWYENTLGVNRFAGWPVCPHIPTNIGVFSAKTASGTGATYVMQTASAVTTGDYGVGVYTQVLASGTPLVVETGSSVTMQWVCQPSLRAGFDAVWGGQTHSYILQNYYADTFSGSGPGFSPPNTLYGSTTVTITGTPGTTVDYTFTCSLTDPAKIAWNSSYVPDIQGDDGGYHPAMPSTFTVTIPVRITSSSMSITSSPASMPSGGIGTITYATKNTTGCTIVGPTSTVWTQAGAPQSFYSTGALQTYTVPAGITSLTAKVWGAGGARGYTGLGGGGGYSIANLVVTPGQILNIIVGKGGIHNGTTGLGTTTYGGGGAAHAYSGAGGGRSAVETQAGVPLVVAGGGGGGGWYGYSVSAGAGGGPLGQDAQGYYDDLYGGNGGTQNAGGSYGGATTTGGSAVYYGGGGGGGYAGGGAASYGPGYYYSGGGGSGYCGAGNSTSCTVAGSASTPANSTDTDLPSGAARGYSGAYTGLAMAGGSGFVKILSYSDVATSSFPTGVLTATATYTLSCVNAEGITVSTSTTITVTPPCGSGQSVVNNVCTCNNGATTASSCTVCSAGQGFNEGGMCVSTTPYGTHEAASCTVTTGWACQDDHATTPSFVNFYADGAAGAGGTYVGLTVANVSRPDVAAAGFCGSNASHGFSFTTPDYVKDGASHTIRAYAVDQNSVTNSLLSSSPITVSGCTCGAGQALLSATCTTRGSLTSFNVVASGSISSSPRVRAGQSPLLTWVTSDMSSCTLKNAAGTTLSSALNATNFAATAITKPDTYTLRCLDAFGTVFTQSKTVGVLPATVEI